MYSVLRECGLSGDCLGLHLSSSGYKIVFDALMSVTMEHWPEFPPYKMPFTEKVSWEVELGDQMWDVNNDVLENYKKMVDKL